MTPDPRVTRILDLVAEYARDRHRPAPFDPSAPRVACAGRVFGGEEVVELVRTSLDFWLTAGPETEAFERRLRETTGHRHARRSTGAPARCAPGSRAPQIDHGGHHHRHPGSAPPPPGCYDGLAQGQGGRRGTRV